MLISAVKFCCKMGFPIEKKSQKSRSVCQDGSRYLGFFLKGKLTCFIAEKNAVSIDKHSNCSVMFQDFISYFETSIRRASHHFQLQS